MDVVEIEDDDFVSSAGFRVRTNNARWMAKLDAQTKLLE
jgi:hypothetical protein